MSTRTVEVSPSLSRSLIHYLDGSSDISKSGYSTISYREGHHISKFAIKFPPQATTPQLKGIITNAYMIRQSDSARFGYANIKVRKILQDWNENITYSTSLSTSYCYSGRVSASSSERYLGDYSEHGYLFEIVPETDLSNGAIAISNLRFVNTIVTPEISNLTIAGTALENQTTVSWEQVDTTSWTLEALKNDGTIIATRTGTTETSCIFNAGELATGDVTFKLTAVSDEATIATCKATFTAPTPVINTVQLSSTDVSTAITVTASKSNDVLSWQVDVIQANSIVATKTGTGAINATFSIGEIKNIGDTIFRVTGFNQWTNSYSDKNVMLTAPMTSVNIFNAVGTSIDNTIECNGVGVNISSWTVQAIQNGVVKDTKTGTGNNISCSFAPGAIKTIGDVTFKLTYVNAWSSGEVSQTVTLGRNEPLIIGLEPSGVTATRDSIIVVSWSSQYQTTFALDVDGHHYAGTTQTKVNIPTGTLIGLGSKQITLTITYTSIWGEVRSTTKTVSFVATGKPQPPVLDDTTYYQKAQPSFTWTSKDAYVQYQAVITKGTTNVVDSGVVTDNTGWYKCTATLTNSTTYVLAIRVKTQHGYWSEWASKTFVTDFAMADKPTISAFVSGKNIIINAECSMSQIFSYCDIYRKTQYGEWVRIAHKLDNNISYTDAYVGKEKYYYKVASVSTSGGVNFSNVVDVTIDIKNFNFVDIANLGNNVEFVGNPTVEFTDVFEVSSDEYAGVFAPICERGEHNYTKATCSFTCNDDVYQRFKNMIKRADVLLYRDGRGKKLFCNVIGDIRCSTFAGEYITISFNIVEVPFVEQDLYIGYGNVSSVFWDGTYDWDGEAYWDGDTNSETQSYSGTGNQTLTFSDGAYRWEENDA